MENRCKQRRDRIALVAVLVLAYFFLCPQDLAYVDRLLAFVEKLLSLTSAVSLGMYALLGVCVVSWTMIQIWGKPQSKA